MVTHPSANHGPSCLTSVILRELVFPTWNCRSLSNTDFQVKKENVVLNAIKFIINLTCYWSSSLPRRLYSLLIEYNKVSYNVNDLFMIGSRYCETSSTSSSVSSFTKSLLSSSPSSSVLSSRRMTAACSSAKFR